MLRELGPERIATLQRALVSIDAASLLALLAASLMSVPLMSRRWSALSTRLPRRTVKAAGAGLIGLALLSASYVIFRGLAANDWPEHGPDALPPDFAPALLVQIATFLVGLTLALRLLRGRTPRALRVFAEAALVPCSYLIGLGIIHLTLSLVDLPMWPGFKRSSFFSAAIFALPVAAIPSAHRPRGSGVVLALLLLVIFGDLIYLRYFGNIMPVLAFGAGGQIWDVRDIIVKYTVRKDAWLLPVVVAAAVPFVWPKAQEGDIPWILRSAFDALLVLTCVAFGLPVADVVQKWMDSDRSWKVLNGTDAVQDSGIVVAHIKEVARSIRDAREHGTISDAEFAKVRAYHAARAVESTSDPDFGLARGTNLVILQVEAMQKWVIGAHVRGQELTPFLNRLQERAWYFDHVYDETGDSSTSDCEYMVLNSQFPIPQGSVAFRRDEDHFVTLLHAFKERGYTTFAGHAYAAGMWNRAVLYPRYGFDQTAFKGELGEGPKLGWGIGDKLFFRRVVPRIEQLKTPFVSMLITLTSHGPYQYVPADERKLVLGGIESSDFGGYLHSMRYNDEAIEQLFDQLRTDGLLENTTLVIYGDHDSRMKFAQSLAVETDLDPDVQRRLATRDYTTKQIPLLVVLPERLHAAPRVVHSVGGQVDIGATISHLFGLKRPGSFIGQSLMPERVGRASRIDGSGVDGKRIFIAPGGGRCESFPDFKRLTLEDCAELRRQTQEELNISWEVTLLDLASKLAGRTPGKAAAQR